MKYYKYSIIAFFAMTVLGTPWLISVYPTSTKFVDNIFSYIGNNYTAALLHEIITVGQLHKKYDNVSKDVNKVEQTKVRIMIVPGHEPGFGGTEFSNLKERDIVVDLSRYLSEFLQNNIHYEVVVARDKTSWNPDLEKYFKNNWDEIVTFLKDSKGEMIHQVNKGEIKKIDRGIIHNNAPKDVAIRLFGINKWNNENHIDIAIHIHLNDYPRDNTSSAGKYSGISIYIPERQYMNSTTTNAIASTIFKRLSKYNAISNMPIENSGVVEEQDLIAIGVNNTLDAPSMLIEYGYIYEPQFSDPSVRESTLRDLAFQTYLGIQDFFGSGNDVSLAYDTLALPYSWKEDTDKNSKNKTEVFALQTALMLEGMYPPKDKSKNDCPRTGKFGPCTANALNSFQNRYGIKNETDVVGEQTKKILNNLYSIHVK